MSLATRTDKSKPLDLHTFDFPKVDKVNMVFPTYNTIPELLEEAKRRGFYNGHKNGNEMFSTLFYKGGKTHFRKDIDPEYLNRVYPYCRALMGSWAPKHEHKSAVCAMLLEEVVERVEEKSS